MLPLYNVFFLNKMGKNGKKSVNSDIFCKFVAKKVVIMQPFSKHFGF